jgi:hypothetical protein
MGSRAETRAHGPRHPSSRIGRVVPATDDGTNAQGNGGSGLFPMLRTEALSV